MGYRVGSVVCNLLGRRSRLVVLLCSGARVLVFDGRSLAYVGKYAE